MTTGIHNDNRTNSTSTTDITPIGIHNASLLPITYMLSSNTSPMISRSQPTYAPLHSLSLMSSTQCQLCFNYIKPLEIVISVIEFFVGTAVVRLTKGINFVNHAEHIIQINSKLISGIINNNKRS